jgi:hypothetical protein
VINTLWRGYEFFIGPSIPSDIEKFDQRVINNYLNLFPEDEELVKVSV